MSHKEIFETISENIFSDADGSEIFHLRHHLQQLLAQQDACAHETTISDWQHALRPNNSDQGNKMLLDQQELIVILSTLAWLALRKAPGMLVHRSS